MEICEEMSDLENSENLPYQCRLCLKDADFCYSLFDEDVTDIIESFTSIKIEENDDLPSICCSTCLEDVYEVYKIRCRIIESDKILREKKYPTIEIKEETVENPENPANRSPLLEKTEVDEIEEITVNPDVVNSDEITINPELNEVLKRRIEFKRRQSQQLDQDCDRDQVNKYLKCTHCEEFFTTSKRAYNAHLATLHCMNSTSRAPRHKGTTVCRICGKQVSTQNYKKHLSVHSSEPQVCELCGAVAKNVESLRGHMFYMHKSTAEQYKCKCGKTYRYKYKYKLHLRKAHGGDRSHICEVCGKAFFTGVDVKRHVEMTHMKLRPYVCQYCNKGFSSSYARRTHVRQHTNEKPFKCEVCAEGFRQRVSLKTHLKSKHGIISQRSNSKYCNNSSTHEGDPAEESSSPT